MAISFSVQRNMFCYFDKLKMHNWGKMKRNKSAQASSHDNSEPLFNSLQGIPTSSNQSAGMTYEEYPFESHDKDTLKGDLDSKQQYNPHFRQYHE